MNPSRIYINVGIFVIQVFQWKKRGGGGREEDFLNEFYF